MATIDDRQHPGAPVVETASGTTSADNSQSGITAYVIAGVTVVLLALFGTGLSSCVSLASDLAMEEYNSGSGYSEDVYGDEDFDYEDWYNQYMEEDLDTDDWLERWDSGDYDDSSTDVPSSLSVEDALDLDLGMYSLTIDSMLPAMSYANASSEVREYVRSVVLADRNGSSDLHDVLRAAAWGESDVSEALDEAIGLAADKADELRELSLPELEGDGAKEVSRQLEQGRTAAIDRWDAISTELSLLSSSIGEVDTDDLMDADDEVNDAAEDAATAFSEALSASSSL